MISQSFWNKTVVEPRLKIFTFLVFIGITILIGLIARQQLKDFPIISATKLHMYENLDSKTIAMIIALKDFQDEEYFVPKEIFEKADLEVITISKEIGKAIGSEGGEATVDIDLSKFNISDFDAIVFIGGSGALEYLDNEVSYKIARDAVYNNKVLAAICISPAILAKAGVLSGKKATVWSSILDKSAVRILEQNGAIYQKGQVVVDGNIITGDGPAAANKFADSIIKVLTKIPK